jgi:hypothetical protein
MADAGVDQYTFHVEPCLNVPFVCRKVKEAGMKVGCVGDYYMISSALLQFSDCILPFQYESKSLFSQISKNYIACLFCIYISGKYLPLFYNLFRQKYLCAE